MSAELSIDPAELPYEYTHAFFQTTEERKRGRPRGNREIRIVRWRCPMPKRTRGQTRNAVSRTRGIEMLLIAIAFIQEHSEGKTGVAAKVRCPCCLVAGRKGKERGTLGYSIARSNGQIMAKCSVKGCIAFIQ